MKIRVLYCSHQSNVLRILDDMFEVIYASTYDEVIRYIDEYMFHVICIDYNLENNIYDILSQLKQYSIYTILLTNNINNIQENIYEYIDDFIIYPISGNFVVHKIKMALLYNKKPDIKSDIVELIEWNLSQICLNIIDNNTWQAVYPTIVQISSIINIYYNKYDNHIVQKVNNNPNIIIQDNIHISQSLYQILFVLMEYYNKERIINYNINIYQNPDNLIIQCSGHITEKYQHILKNMINTNINNYKIIVCE